MSQFGNYMRTPKQFGSSFGGILEAALPIGYRKYGPIALILMHHPKVVRRELPLNAAADLH